ncbi:uncharacterized protein LOC142476421 [Ascaphus truei]|uniref:uncharacterized protein LOC142476421 n=1 Tax=Ascaphus truei TaxID=8439 RepID=UPI003F591891
MKCEIVSMIERGEEPCVQRPLKWEDQESPKPANTGRVIVKTEAEEKTRARNHQPMEGRQLLKHVRRHVRRRCSRRSPNFSRAELESFVALMDRFLPDERQRTGEISLRQRRATLLEISRRLEPMSGCLRTPRQLLHRWADFNNRDPDRLADIRVRLRRGDVQRSVPARHRTRNKGRSAHRCAAMWGGAAPRQERAPREPGDNGRGACVLTSGRRWRRRYPRPLPSAEEEEDGTGEEQHGEAHSALWEEGSQALPAPYCPGLPLPVLPTSLCSHIDAEGLYVDLEPPYPAADCTSH